MKRYFINYNTDAITTETDPRTDSPVSCKRLGRIVRGKIRARVCPHLGQSSKWEVLKMKIKM